MEVIRDEFEILAAKVLAAEATPGEVARLNTLLAENPELDDEFAELRATWASLEEVGPLAEAMEAPRATPPAERVKKWEATLKEKFGTAASECANSPQRRTHSDHSVRWLRRHFALSRWQLAAVAACVFLAAVIAATLLWRGTSTAPSGAVVAYLISRQGAAEVERDGKMIRATDVITLRAEDEIRVPPGAVVTIVSSNRHFLVKGPQRFDARRVAEQIEAAEGGEINGAASSVVAALFVPVRQTAGLLVRQRSGHGIRVYSPAGFTASLTPPVLWKSAPGKTYDIVITDELTPTAPPFRHTGGPSPLDFRAVWPNRALAEDGLYRLSISERDNRLSATEVVFRTLTISTNTSSAGETRSGGPAEKLLVAWQILTTTPSHLGDALAELLALPSDIANSELALRLKLFAFGQLGYQEDFEATLTQLER